MVNLFYTLFIKDDSVNLSKSSGQVSSFIHLFFLLQQVGQVNGIKESYLFAMMNGCNTRAIVNLVYRESSGILQLTSYAHLPVALPATDQFVLVYSD